jgi:hypothetical protein
MLRVYAPELGFCINDFAAEASREDGNRNRRGSGASRGDGCECKTERSGVLHERNRPQQRPRVDNIATDAIAARVGAMDVSAKRSAAEYCTNVIARSDDRANSCARVGSPLRRGLQSLAERIGVLCAEDWSPLRKGLCLSAQRLSTISECRRAVDAAGDYVRLRSLRIAPTHIHRPYSRRCRVGCKVVARSTLRAITFVCARFASHRLTSSPLLAPLSRRLQSRRAVVAYL